MALVALAAVVVAVVLLLTSSGGPTYQVTADFTGPIHDQVWSTACETAVPGPRLASIDRISPCIPVLSRNKVLSTFDGKG